MKKLMIFIIALAMVCIVGSSVHADLSDGLVVHYTLNGSANDESGNNNHGTEEGGLVYVDGAIAQGAYFDGLDDCISGEFANIKDITNTFTIAFWAYPLGTHQIDPESTSGGSGTSGQKYVIGPGHGSWWGSDHKRERGTLLLRLQNFLTR